MSRRPAFFAALMLSSALVVGCKDPGVDLYPKRGPYIGGDPVVISGGHFTITQGLKVYFGKNAAKAPVIRENGDLVVEPPSGDVNQVVDVIVVFDDAHELRLPKAYTYIDPTAINTANK